MAPLRPGILRLFRIPDPARDVDDEVELHLALRIESLMQEGMDRAAAESEARRRFATTDQALRDLHHSATRRSRRMHLRMEWESVGQDIRYAIRRFGRERMVTAFIVLTLALGIGANATAFALVNRIFLRGPEHLSHPEELARLYIHTDGPPLGERTMAWMPYWNIENLRETARGIRGIAGFRVDDRLVGAGASARRMRLGTADGHFFPLLGVQPLLGRFFTPGEDALTDGPLAVLSEATWRADFSADPSVLGSSIVINEVPHTIIGVAPAGFTGATLARVDLWALFNSKAANSNNWNTLVRRDPGLPLETLSAEVEGAHRRSAGGGPKWARWTEQATLLAAPIGSNDEGRPALETVVARWFAAIALIVLLISCANVVNLQLARLARRRQELGIRVALGAGRGRVIRLLLLEGLVLGAVSGAASLMVAAVLGPVVRSALFVNAGWSPARMTGPILLLVGLFTFVTCLVIGCIPAFEAGTARQAVGLKSGTRVGDSRSRFRQGLTVAQAALSVLLLVGAGLFLRSLAQVRAVDLGMEPDRVLVVEATTPRDTGSPEARSANERTRYRELLEAVQRLPGVEQSALTVGLPFYGSFGVGLWLPGLDSIPQLPSGGPFITAVGPGYFATMGTELRRGRLFDASDREGSAPVVIVGEAMAHALWPAGNALAGCLTLYERTAPCAQVVGVVSDIHRSGLREAPSFQYYVPIGQEQQFSGMSIIVRPTPGGLLSWDGVKHAMFASDPSLLSVEITPLAAALDGEMRPLRLGMLTFGLGGALAMIVAALGLYSVIAYMVAWRTQEIGVRMALGATAGAVGRMVVGESTRLAGLGIGLGLAVAYFCRGLIEPQLFEVSGADPLVYAGVAVTLLGVALLAGWLPARRAASIRPTEALRAE